MILASRFNSLPADTLYDFGHVTLYQSVKASTADVTRSLTCLLPLTPSSRQFL